MRLYEGMFLFDSNLASRDWPGLERHTEDLLKRNSSELVYSERWPDRKLAYEIKGCRKGTYYLTYFKAPPEAIGGLERDCRLSERVLRVLVVADDGIEGDLRKRRERQEAEAARVREKTRAEAESAGASTASPTPAVEREKPAAPAVEREKPAAPEASGGGSEPSPAGESPASEKTGESRES